MWIFLQIIIVNIIVSCDNVSVIALATRNLPTAQATAARRLGVILSVALKLVFIAVIGVLFSLPWLHIRIIGGVTLLYVTYTMLRQNDSDKGAATSAGKDVFLLAILSIIVADVSMSLDNVIAILGIAAADGQQLSANMFITVSVALLISIPLLLWFSGGIERLIERFPIFSFVCAGYLAYTAIKMICEDEMIKIFFRQIHFTLTTPMAILCGVLIVVFRLIIDKKGVFKAENKRMLRMSVIVILYTIMNLAIISYLSTNPEIEGKILSVESLYGFVPMGANSIFLVAVIAGVMRICMAFYVPNVTCASSKQPYPAKFILSISAMLKLLALETVLCTAGLSISFGFGAFKPLVMVGGFLFQAVLLCGYVAVFCMFSMLVRNKKVGVILSVFYVLLEEILTTILPHSRIEFVVGLLPNYYLENFTMLLQPGFVIRGILAAAICIICAAWIGCKRKHAGNRAF
ncbi:MAG: YjbE family putative metal transport protein [Clostridiales bacterium]|jgi:YjbE family integral membrane protein|nr:YjbE family putative metal transport protein [Clostridiales bacterium]